MQTVSLILAAALAASLLPPGAANAEQPPTSVPPLTDLPGVLPWSTLAKVGTVKVAGGGLIPKYPAIISALDNTEVKLQGFMMPLEAGAKQKHFLLTVTSPSCSFCLPAGPEGVVEIKTDTPVKFTYAPIVMSGTMKILKTDPMGLYYRLTAATMVPK